MRSVHQFAWLASSFVLLLERRAWLVRRASTGQRVFRLPPHAPALLRFCFTSFAGFVGTALSPALLLALVVLAWTATPCDAGAVSLNTASSSFALAPAGYSHLAPAVAALSARELPRVAAACHARADVTPRGEPVSGTSRLTQLPDAGACCASCSAHAQRGAPPLCNSWAFNARTRVCWIRHAPLFPEAPILTHRPGRNWTSGVLFTLGGEGTSSEAERERSRPPSRCVHTIVTSNGAPDVNWQTRLLHASWVAAAAAEGPGGLLSAFTRLLYCAPTGDDDALWGKVPTHRISVKSPGFGGKCDKSYPAGDRAAALSCWASNPDYTRCSHVLVTEPDFLFVRAPPAWSLPVQGTAVAAFFDIRPASPLLAPISSRHLPAGFDVFAAPCAGGAPLLLTLRDLPGVAGRWANAVARLEADPGAVASFGPVREMYAFSFAAAAGNVSFLTPTPPFNVLTAALLDDTLGDASRACAGRAGVLSLIPNPLIP